MVEIYFSLFTVLQYLVYGRQNVSHNYFIIITIKFFLNYFSILGNEVENNWKV